MTDDIPHLHELLRPICSSEQTRLATAACVSLVLHAGVLALQPGKTPWATGPAGGQAGPLGESPAPLTVTLAPYRLQPAVIAMSATVEPQVRLLRQPQQSSPAIADSSHGDGGTAQAAEKQRKELATAPGLPVEEYFDADAVSIRPAIMADPEFDLPELGSIAGDGKALLTLYINEFGHVDKVEIESAGGIDTALVGAVARQFGNAIFEPARIDGAAVKSRLRIEILLRPLMTRN